MGFKWYSRKENITGGVSPARNVEEEDKDTDVAEKYQPVVDWFEKYLDSDTYNTLTGKMKERAGSGIMIDEATKWQKKYVKDYPTIKAGEHDTGEPSITEEKHAGERGRYSRESVYSGSNRGGEINIDPDLSDEAAFETMIHELGHTDRNDMTLFSKEISQKNPYFVKLADAISKVSPKFKENLEAGKYHKLHEYIDKYIYHASISSLVKELGISEELAYTISWAAQPYEVRSELMKLRYQAEKAGIHMSTGDFEEFTQEKLDALRKVLNEEGNPLNNLLLNTKFKDGVEFSDEDIIWYMNNIAMEKEEKKQDFTGGEMDEDSALTMKGKIIGGVSA
jgi:hypothetical protein